MRARRRKRKWEEDQEWKERAARLKCSQEQLDVLQGKLNSMDDATELSRKDVKKARQAWEKAERMLATRKEQLEQAEKVHLQNEQALEFSITTWPRPGALS